MNKLIYLRSHNFFSSVGNGFGTVLMNISNLVFLLIFQLKLHQIKDPSTKQYLRKMKAALIIILSLGILWERFGHGQEHLLGTHIANIIRTLILFILLPKYYINQNPNFKLYLNVYHHQPPPVLPWQLPGNFDAKGTKLITVDFPSK